MKKFNKNVIQTKTKHMEFYYLFVVNSK